MLVVTAAQPGRFRLPEGATDKSTFNVGYISSGADLTVLSYTPAISNTLYIANFMGSCDALASGALIVYIRFAGNKIFEYSTGDHGVVMPLSFPIAIIGDGASAFLANIYNNTLDSVRIDGYIQAWEEPTI